MRRAAVALFELRMAQEVARRLSVWKQRQLRSAMELSKERASSTVHYQNWEVVLEGWSGGVRVVDFYYSDEARRAAAEGLHEGEGGRGNGDADDSGDDGVVGERQPDAEEDAISGDGEDVTVELEATLENAESCRALGTRTEGQQLEAVAGGAEASSAAEDAAVAVELRSALVDAEAASRSRGGDAVVPGTEGQQLEAAAGGVDENIRKSEELLSGWLENEAAVWEHGESAVKARQAQQHAQRACAAVQKERAARVCPVVRSRWIPQHRPGVRDDILVPRSGKGRNYHYFQRCPALQSDECDGMPELGPATRYNWRYLLMVTARFKSIMDSRSINGSANSERLLMRHRKICRLMHSVSIRCGYLTMMLKLWHRT